MDEAAGYRASTNFITGIPYAEMCDSHHLLLCAVFSSSERVAVVQSGGEEHALHAVCLPAAVPSTPL